MKKILIAPNSFKECCTSVEVSKLIAAEFLGRLKNHYELIQLPISDGGDGFLEVCKQKYNLISEMVDIPNCYNNENLSVEVGISQDGETLYIESALAFGLKTIPVEFRHPMNLSSKGLGDLLLHYKKRLLFQDSLIKKIIIGVGGTGTTDLGLGACSRFGLKIFDFYEKEVEVIPSNFYKAAAIEWTPADPGFDIELILDVRNDLLGKEGALFLFSPQKGAKYSEIKVLELGFNKIINLLKNKKLIDSSDNLFGAGGGLSVGLGSLLLAKCRFGEEFILNDLGLNNYLYSSEIIITGEGIYDEQSQMGKGAGLVVQLAKEHNKKVFLICGKVKEEIKEKLQDNVYPIEMLKFFSSNEESINNYKLGLKLAVDEILDQL
ncbi:MAG: glycerate kinase [Ignavibacteriaceae bacterium]|nr:glycerate kinase [Ignavibacteriaceae bacterium]